jgi:hypothetical protein
MSYPKCPTGHRPPRVGCLVLLALLVGAVPAAPAADIEREPIHYSTAPADNPVSRLQQRLDTAPATLTYDKKTGYLRPLLAALNVPESSQMLVFSKTSLQRERIGPRTPRALYFNDEVYVGFCQHGTVLEVTAADPQLGAVFYTLEQEPAERPQFVRQGDSCLICHASSQNQGFPGPLVRSVYPDAGGFPILSAGTHRIDHTSPLEQRWGGWYVTGTSGRQKHLGNRVLRDKRHPRQEESTEGLNATDLGRWIATAPYPTGHSDIVALLVLEHQAEMHNLITRANFLTRQALYEEADINKALGRPADYRSESTVSRIKNAGEPLLKYLLFCGEAPLTDPVKGTSGFAEEFVQRGPRDERSRSLRDFDLRRRLFKYPCSYLIYSAAFDALPGPVKEYVLQRLWEVLSGKDASPDFAHLSAEDRRAILEILRATKPGLPDSWRRSASAAAVRTGDPPLSGSDTPKNPAAMRGGARAAGRD